MLPLVDHETTPLQLANLVQLELFQVSNNYHTTHILSRSSRRGGNRDD